MVIYNYTMYVQPIKGIITLPQLIQVWSTESKPNPHRKYTSRPNVRCVVKSLTFLNQSCSATGCIKGEHHVHDKTYCMFKLKPVVFIIIEAVANH